MKQFQLNFTNERDVRNRLIGIKKKVDGIKHYLLILLKSKQSMPAANGTIGIRGGKGCNKFIILQQSMSAGLKLMASLLIERLQLLKKYSLKSSITETKHPVISLMVI